MAFLTGILIGSMKKVWPWKETLESKIIRGKLKILREANVMPEAFDAQVILAIAVAIIGFGLVLWMESKSQSLKSIDNKDSSI
jgi:putative membrane protein